MKNGFQATTFRSTLIVIIILLVAAIGTGFYYVRSQLQTYSEEVSEVVNSSGAQPITQQDSQNLETKLAAHQDTITKLTQLFSSTQTSQAQAIADITAYAQAAGLTVSNFSFPENAVAGPVGFPTQAVNVTIASPANYLNLLRFIHAIETNLPKMQIASINLGRTSNGSVSDVTTDALTIQVYVQ